jgi:sRNA-binding carbon storage regulator CsrA|eukprot:CAMPEP_0119045952 /NCGR_PEP_ID=MMETSP1177-20130426/43551_1 /TAXON_ID=2985 /ORGANISM="Ochromonas sp, Strain CCMP1899" /LENGTH=71 /DNA_ID=CAMNT_0007018461 /DNA_START=559 /DNA_END=774 /DNA_ORIENTATION=-
MKSGLVDADLDCVAIPMSKLGIRKKIIALHDLNLFYQEIKEEITEEEDEESERSDEDSDDDENESEGSEEN